VVCIPEARRWSEQELKILEELYTSDKVTLDDIAKVLVGRSRESIIAKAHKMKWTRPAGAAMDLEYYKQLQEVIEG